ncbi:MAG TPA: DUF6220 domain-containing protein [Microvirga sp.]|nr:DUF6220 domain-containing protein [Microvirga sp.]
MQTQSRQMPSVLLPTIMIGMSGTVPLLIVTQLFLAGLAIFADGNLWELHGAVGGFTALPITGVLLMSILARSQRRLRGFSILTFSLYALQLLWLAIGETTGIDALRAVHAANAGLLLLSSAALAHRSIRTM